METSQAEEKEVQQADSCCCKKKKGNCSHREEREKNRESEKEGQKAAVMEIAVGEWESLGKERDEYKDKYWRLLAESENARKRIQREKEDLARFSIENIVLDWLKPLDQMDKALHFAEQMSDEVKNWAMGFQMIHQQMKDVLVQHGIVAFDSEGRQFDPHLHEALEMVETADFPANTVIKQLCRGYRLGERVIRAAQVQVATPPASGEQRDQSDQEMAQQDGDQEEKEEKGQNGEREELSE